MLYVLYKNGSYAKTETGQYKESKNVKSILIPLDVVGKGVYLPVNPKYFQEFHHGKISLTIRHSLIDWDEVVPPMNVEWSFTSKKEFTNPIDFFSYLHTIHRITGMERIKAYGTTDIVECIQVFDIIFAEVHIYDADNICIYHKKHKNNESLTAEKIEHDSYYIRNNSDACEKFTDLISIFRMVPFESNGIILNKHKKTWSFSRDGSYCPLQFIPMEDFHCFYFNKDNHVGLLWNVISEARAILRSQTYLITTFDIEGASPDLMHTTLEEIIDGGDIYYSSTDFSNLDYPAIIEFLVCYRIFSQYSILEAMYCIFEDPSAAYNLVISIELIVNNFKRRLLVPSNYYPNDFKYIVEDLLL